MRIKGTDSKLSLLTLLTLKKKRKKKLLLDGKGGEKKTVASKILFLFKEKLEKSITSKTKLWI